jgi:AcrR family transcriptional regulator
MPNRRAEAAILDATARLLATKRLEELTVADVMAEADVSRASFYLYFSSKHAAAAALMRRVVGEFYVAASVWFDHDGDEPHEALRQALRDVETRWREHAPVVNTAVETWRSSPEMGDLWSGLVTAFTDAAAARIEQDRGVGMAPDGHEARALATALVWMTERCYYLATIGVEQVLLPDGAVSKVLADVWLRAVYGGRGTEAP